MQRLLFVILLTCLSIGTLSANGLREAQGLLESGQRDKAMVKVNAFLKSQPNNAEARFLKGLVLVEQGKTRAAIGVFTGLTKDYPELPEPYNNLAVIHASNGDYDRARAALQAALKTHPSYATAYENLGDIYAKLASEAYQQALDLEQRDAGKLKVKLSLIDNLFLSEEIPVATATPEIVRPTPVSEPVKPIAVVNHAPLIIKTLKSWAAAWSAQDVDKYLSYYASTFRPAKGSAKKWRAQRNERLLKPEFIRVGLNDIQLVRLSEKAARIELMQTYESNTYKDESQKRFDLIRVNGQWQINRERGL